MIKESNKDKKLRLTTFFYLGHEICICSTQTYDIVMSKILALLFFFSTAFTTFAVDHFWIGGTGNWNDINHWSLSSGGPAGVSVPSASDNAIFDDNSGLTVAGVVTMNANINVLDFDFSLVSNQFTFDSPAPITFEITGSLLGNASSVLFTGTWGEITLNAASPGEVISSLGTIWNQSFRIIGNDVSTTDNFNIGNNTLYVDMGGIDLSDDTLTCLEFHANLPSIRAITVTNALLNISNGYWDVDGTNLTWTGGGSTIMLGDNATLAQFYGGNLSYDTVISSSALDFECYGTNDFGLLDLVQSSQLKIENTMTLRADSLIANGSCVAPMMITTTGVGGNAMIEKTGFPQLLLSSVDITDVDALAGPLYEVINETLTNASGWTPIVGGSMFWIGNSGNWNDGAHWSYVSGGLPNGCIPDSLQQVFFDANSFSLSGQTVTIDDTAFFLSMDWTGIIGNQSLVMDSSMYAYGDIILHADLFVGRSSYIPTLIMNRPGTLTVNGAETDASLTISPLNNGDVVQFVDDLYMSDSSTISLLKGQLNTLNNTVRTGWFSSVNDTTTSLDARQLDLGNSTIEVVREFNTLRDTGLVLNAGTSHIYIGDTVKYLAETQRYLNGLKSYGHTFYDVTLNFQNYPNTVQQIVNGDNSFNKLRILPGSEVYLEAGKTQTVNDSLILFSNCAQAIYLGSTDTSATNNLANLTATTNSFSCQALTLEQIDASGGVAITTFHSIDSVSNPGWIFDQTPATIANLTVDGPFCLGDTTVFTNLSTVETGNLDDLTSKWYFGDGSTGYWQPSPPPQDSIYVTYEVDTTQHVFTYAGTITVKLETTNTVNQCSDDTTFQIEIYNPSIVLTTTDLDGAICAGTEVTFEASSYSDSALFEFFLNGVSLNTPSKNDTLYTTSVLVDEDTVSVLAYEEGCVSDTMPALGYTVHDIPTFNFTSSDLDQTICDSDSVGFVAANPAEPSYEYQFFINSSSVTGFADTINVFGTDTLNNSDVIYAVVRDTLGCRDTLSMTFTVDPLPTTTLTSSVSGNVICDGESVTFTGSGADQYEFYINGVVVQTLSGITSYTTAALTANDTITMLGVNATTCQMMAPESYTYIVNPSPSVSMTSSDLDNSICSGDQVTFTASGAPLYEFFVNGSSAQLGTNPALITTGLNDGDIISVTGVLGACSSQAMPINMTVLTSPTTTLINNDDGDNTICFGTEVIFTASGATNYEFFIDGSSVQGPSTVAILTTQTLIDGQTITVQGESNTCIIDASETFTVLNNPVVNFFSSDLDNTICDGDAIEFTGANAGSYEFYVNGTSVQGPSVLTTLSNPSLTIGNNQVQVIGIGGNGCTDTSLVMNIAVNPIPVITLTSSDLDNTICANENVIFTGAGADMYQFFVGATPQGSMSANNTFSTSGLLNGQTVSVSGSLLGCPSSSTGITTTVNPIPNVSLTSTDINNVYCESDVVDYTAGGANNYEFFVDGTSQGPSASLNTLNSSGFPSGLFDLEVVGETNNCFDTTTMAILINTSPTASISSSDPNNTICAGEAVTYTGAGGDIYAFFINGVSQGAPSVNNTITLNGLVDGDEVAVEVATGQGCTDRDTMNAIVVNPTPVVSLSSSDPNQEICIGDNVDFTASGATDYEFFVNGASQGSATANPIFTTTGLTNGDNISVIGSSLGCMGNSNNLMFTVYAYPVVYLTNNGDTSICVGENTDVEAFGAINYQFEVNNVPAGPFSGVSSFNSSLNNGDVVTVLGETNGCVSPSQNSFEFTVFNYPTISSLVTPGTTICLNDLVNISSSGAMEYQFDLNGITQQVGSAGSFDTDALEDGYIISVTGLNGDCPSNPDVFIFTVNTMDLSLDVSPSAMICDGTPVTFTAAGADQYEFFLNGISTGPMGATNTYVSSVLSDMDEVTFVGYNTTTLCTQPYDDYILMNVLTEPSIDPLSTATFCEGDSVILVSNSSYGNQWYVDGNPIAGANDTAYVAYDSGDYALGITSGGNGDVWSFGQNATGSFGNGNNLNSGEPLVAATNVQFDELSAGYGFVLGISNAEELYSWGENSSGQLGDGTYTSVNVPQAVPTMTNIKTVATSKSSSMAVTNAGDVYVWGSNTQGQLGTGNTAVITFPFQNTVLNNTDSIAGGKEHFVILKNDGTVWTVGNNDYGQLGEGTMISSSTPVQVVGISNAVSVGAGEYHSFAIDAAGDLLVWGSNGSGQLGLGDLNNRLTPEVSDLQNIIHAEGGAAHSAFLSSDNKLYMTGNNTLGQLGTGNFNDTTRPVLMGLSGVDLVSTGEYTTLIKRNDNSVFGCGNNVEEQLSSLNGNAINSPEHISDLDGATFIEAGRYTSHVLFGENETCISQVVNVEMLATPIVSITADEDTLFATAGVSYQWYFEGNPIPGATSQNYIANQTGNYWVEVTFANGCTGFSDEHYYSSLSVHEMTENTIRMYPNPTNKTVTLEFEKQVSQMNVQLVDLAGKVVLQAETFSGSQLQLDLSGLNSGLYLVYIKEGNETRVLKLEKL